MTTYLSLRTTARLIAYLDNIVFPCTRAEILNCAEDNEAPDAILDAIENLPERRYWSVGEIMARTEGDSRHHSSAVFRQARDETSPSQYEHAPGG